MKQTTKILRSKRRADAAPQHADQAPEAEIVAPGWAQLLAHGPQRRTHAAVAKPASARVVKHLLDD